MNQRKTAPNESAKIIAEMLGFVAREAKETIISDIIFMLNKNLNKELDGYVYALSRIIEKKLMHECVTDAFLKCNIPIPEKYEKKIN